MTKKLLYTLAFMPLMAGTLISCELQDPINKPLETESNIVKSVVIKDYEKGVLSADEITFDFEYNSDSQLVEYVTEIAGSKQGNVFSIKTAITIEYLKGKIIETSKVYINGKQGGAPSAIEYGLNNKGMVETSTEMRPSILSTGESIYAALYNYDDNGYLTSVLSSDFGLPGGNRDSLIVRYTANNPTKYEELYHDNEGHTISVLEVTYTDYLSNTNVDLNRSRSKLNLSYTQTLNRRVGMPNENLESTVNYSDKSYTEEGVLYYWREYQERYEYEFDSQGKLMNVKTYGRLIGDSSNTEQPEYLEAEVSFNY